MVLNHSSVALLYTWGCCTVGSWTSALVSSILQTVTNWFPSRIALYLAPYISDQIPSIPTTWCCHHHHVSLWAFTGVFMVLYQCQKTFFFFFWSHQLRESFYSFAKYPPCLFGKLQTGFHVFSSKHYSMKLIFMACPGYGFLPNIL